jgi:hypothetical protein
LVAIIGGIFGLATTIIVGHQRKQLREVHEQVKNTHSTNMREDIDDLAHGMRRLMDKVELLIEGQRRQETENAELRADLRIERQERMALADRVRELSAVAT